MDSDAPDLGTNMKANLYWIERSGPGRLAILARPRGGDWLEDEIQTWKRAGVNLLVSALTAAENRELDLENEEALCRTHGIEFVSFPINDREFPASMNSTRELAQALTRALLHGKSVAIHCRQGVGRSSLLAASVLVLEGVDAKTAFERIHLARGCLVPDTTEQRRWVELFARESFKVSGKPERVMP